MSSPMAPNVLGVGARHRRTAVHRDDIRGRLPDHMGGHLDHELCPSCEHGRADRPAAAASGRVFKGRDSA